MKCDVCGQDTGRTQVNDTRSRGGSGITFGNKTVPLALCAACARRRRATQRFVVFVFVLVGAGILVAGLVLR